MKKYILLLLSIMILCAVPVAAEVELDNSVYLIDAWSGTEQITDLKGTSSPDGAVLSWAAIPEAEGYLIGAIQNGNPYKQIGYVTGGNTTTYIDRDASLTAYSYYWVFPYKKVDGKVVRGKVSSRYVYGIKLLPAPQNFTAVSVPNAVELSWSPVSDTYRYVIKCRRGNGPVEILGTAYSNNYTDSNAPTDVVSYYWVFASKSSYPNDLIGASSLYAYGKAIPNGAGFTELGRYLMGYQFSDSVSCFILLRNDYGGPSAIEANITAYDAGGNIIGVNRARYNTSKPGDRIVLEGFFSDIALSQINHISYVLSSEKAHFESRQSDVGINYSIVGNKVIATFTNNSQRDIDYCRADVLFFKNGKVVYNASDSVLDISSVFKAGASTVREFSAFDEPFDNVIIVCEAHSYN